MNILAISIGGTISQEAVDGRMSIHFDERKFLSAIPAGAKVDFVNYQSRVGANLRVRDLFLLRDKLLGFRQQYDGFIVLTGTDSLEEVAFGLDLLLDMKQPIVVTGAMRPKDALGFDGLRNFRDAVQVVMCQDMVSMGVLVVISEHIHSAQYVRKLDSQLVEAFQSIPGPVGEIRRGQPIFSYLSIPAIVKYEGISLDHLPARVPIVTMCLGCEVDPSDYMTCDGLILAGMGTGSLPDSVTTALSESLTEKIPVCITTRCASGHNYDDYYYQGSLEKYTSKGFILRGYEGLSPYQARIKLMFEIAKIRSSV